MRRPRLLGECFAFQAIDALSFVRALERPLEAARTIRDRSISSASWRFAPGIAIEQTAGHSMDKKIKKKQDVLRQRLQKLQQQLAGARRQMDDPDEVRRLEQEVAATEAELEKLK